MSVSHQAWVQMKTVIGVRLFHIFSSIYLCTEKNIPFAEHWLTPAFVATNSASTSCFGPHASCCRAAVCFHSSLQMYSPAMLFVLDTRPGMQIPWVFALCSSHADICLRKNTIHYYYRFWGRNEFNAPTKIKHYIPLSGDVTMSILSVKITLFLRIVNSTGPQ